MLNTIYLIWSISFNLSTSSWFGTIAISVLQMRLSATSPTLFPKHGTDGFSPSARPSGQHNPIYPYTPTSNSEKGEGKPLFLVLLCGQRDALLQAWFLREEGSHLIKVLLFWWALVWSPTSHITSKARDRIWINIWSYFIDDISFQTPLICLALIKFLNFLLILEISCETCMHTLSHFKRSDCSLQDKFYAVL